MLTLDLAYQLIGKTVRFKYRMFMKGTGALAPGSVWRIDSISEEEHPQIVVTRSSRIGNLRASFDPAMFCTEEHWKKIEPYMR